MTSVLYQLDTDDIKQVLQVAHEIESEIGIVLAGIVLQDGRHVLFNKKNFSLLSHNEITVEKYISNNLVIGY